MKKKKKKRMGWKTIKWKRKKRKTNKYQKKEGWVGGIKNNTTRGIS